MHTVHLVQSGLAGNGFAAAALGIIFDTTNYDKSVTAAEVAVIDKFFENLDFASNDPTPSSIAYGELYSMVDANNRWVYKGSVTTPPCAVLVYWNVIRKVYPIKKKHLDLYVKTQLARKSGQDIVKTGNFRVVQKVTPEHKLQLLTTDMPAEEES